MTMSRTTAEQRYAHYYGRLFGSLTFVGLSDARGDKRRLLGVFLCVCGVTVDRPLGRVVRGTITHCGCRTTRVTNHIHGMRGTPEYSSWQAMKVRCCTPSSKDYPRWGGAGIRVCPEWQRSFEAFYAHIGPRPDGTTLDRIDNTKGYEPGNVRWATHREQQANRRDTYEVEIAGETFQSMADAARAHGVTEMTVKRWCEGDYDHRRGRHIAARYDCRRRRKYA